MKGLQYQENNNEKLYELSEQENNEVSLKKMCGDEKKHIYYHAVPWVCTANDEVKKNDKALSEHPIEQIENNKDDLAVKKLNIGLKLSLKDYISAGFHFLWQKSEPVISSDDQNDDHTNTKK